MTATTRGSGAAARTKRAVVAVRGDDVYEDLFTASVELQAILQERDFATEVRLGTAKFVERPPLADLLVLFTAAGAGIGGTGNTIDRDREASAIRGAVTRGTGLITIHSSNLGGPIDVIGTRFLDHGPEPHESRFTVVADEQHPVGDGVKPFNVVHEHYRVAVAEGTQVVAWRNTADGQREPITTVRRIGCGRTVWIQLGHDMRIWGEPGLRRLIHNASAWTTSPDPDTSDERS